MTEMIIPREYRRRRESLDGWDVAITSYRLDEQYYCHVDNVSPGARIARATADSAAAAEASALADARRRLATTRRRS